MKKEIPGFRVRIPCATYRLQFNRQFTFKEAITLIEYLDELGISDCYASPLLAARAGSLHGYDVIDHSRLNSEIGDEEGFSYFALRLRERGMGLIMDVVPNHMCVSDGANQWWNDVLENGPSSPYARFFDIDWQPPKADLADKVLLPLLGEQYGRVLENLELRLGYMHGAFFIRYYESLLPITPCSYTQILGPLLERMSSEQNESQHNLMELESIVTALNYLPPLTETDKERRTERQREKEVIKRRLDKFIEDSEGVQSALHRLLKEFNGEPGGPHSFERLERLLADQPYRLSHWRVAADEINYRRFFDINELAAIRVEESEVFIRVHELTLRLMRQGLVTGLRIDHVDGLFDPVGYLSELQVACLDALIHSTSVASAPFPRTPPQYQLTAASNLPVYIVVEKILGHDELLRQDWAVYGTTGYGFMNLLNGVFIDTANKHAFEQLYERLTGQGQSINFSDLVYECKKLILGFAMSSELHVLARRLDRISEQYRYSRDFTLNSLQYALGEVIACFPIYRTYTRMDQVEVNEEDQRHIRRAIRDARRRNPTISPSIFDFIGSLLLLEDPAGLNEEMIAERRIFVLRFQQLTGPVMAKGLEDTAFFRYFPLASLNEVGGEPARFGITLEAFHSRNQQRMQERPHGLSATSTHDTKRNEDVRARLNVLSEIPTKWYRALLRWRKLNQDYKTQVDGLEAPDSNDEYLIYQTIIGAWPLAPQAFLIPERLNQFARRIEGDTIKAIREAKAHTSWVSPNEEYERGVKRFIRTLLEFSPENRFLIDFLDFQQVIARCGMFNSLSQTLLKITSPGVPDFYQGTEIWDLRLMDPDSRGPVDFAMRQTMLNQIREAEKGDLVAFIKGMMRRPEDGRIKMYLTQRALLFRRAHYELFATGAYHTSQVGGKHHNSVITFTRATRNESVLVAAGRFFTRIGVPEQLPIGQAAWEDTAIVIEGRTKSSRYRNILTNELLPVNERNDKTELPLAEVFTHLPVALLEQI
jgi:(1->4)-alpha-D-glucan 1-alpha-D-glucosylmutase